MTALFIITSNNKTPQLETFLSSPAPESTQWRTDDSSLRAGLLSWEWPLQNYVILTGLSEQPDLREGILI